ncbi:MAG: hypothetical protein Q4D04_16030 [Clostridia bacterium]|nr:hypothetical protein [Clostridia bacterium]
MSDYPSNSNRAREQATESPQRRAEKVVSGTVTQRKKSGLNMLGSAFIANDMKDVKDYILQDVLIPTVKRAFFDIVCNGTGMLLGERNPRRGGGRADEVSYRSYYDRNNGRRSGGDNNTRARSNYSYKDLIFYDRGDAEVVLERMYEILERYDAVSVGDLFDLAGETSVYTDNKYGWTNLDDAYVKPVTNGYIIQLPRATTL